MIVAGWAWDDSVLLSVVTGGLVWKIAAAWLLLDLLFVWAWSRAVGGPRR